MKAEVEKSEIVQKPRKKKNSNKIHKNTLGYLLLIPTTLLILCISIYPVLNALYISMTNYNLLNPKARKFIGLDNIINIVTKDSEVWASIGFTVAYTFSVVCLSYLLGLGLALLLNKDIKFRGFFRALVLIPWIIPPVIGATNWLWVLNDQYGIVNLFLERIGVIKSPILFFADPNIAKVTVIMTGAWKSFPFMVIVILAGLQAIPRDLYEAAYIDGAGAIKSFYYITFPMIKGVTMICTTLMSIWTFNSFENIYLLTQGGPANSTFVMSIQSYFTAFFRNKLGYASAVAVVMLIIMLILSTLYLRALGNNNNNA